MSNIEQIAMVPVEQLVEDLSVYPRFRVDDYHVSELAEALRAGAILPPCVVEAGTYRIVDGIHRKRAYARAGRSEVPCILRTYLSEADLFEEAMRLNAGHGRRLTAMDRRRCVLIAEELGLSLERISIALSATPEAIKKWAAQVAVDEVGRPVPVKRGLEPSTFWTKKQQQVNERWGGMQASFYARQLILYLRGGFYREGDQRLTQLLDELVDVWTEIRNRKSA